MDDKTKKKIDYSRIKEVNLTFIFENGGYLWYYIKVEARLV